jgi:predicted  nucleic acid-binding Zn-ribbon protein
MSGGGGSFNPSGVSGTTPLGHRESRWRTSQYGDITKLREYAAKHAKVAARYQTRAARINTKIEKLRHHSAILREKAEAVLHPIPEWEQEISQYTRNIQASTQRTAGIVVGSDVTTLEVRIRKLRQRVANAKLKSQSLKLKAAQRTQKVTELQVKVNFWMEKSRLEEQESKAYESRADKLQMVSQAETAERLAAQPPGDLPPPPPPPPPDAYRPL